MKKDTKEKIYASFYYFGSLGIISFLKKSTSFEKFHAVQGLSLFCFFSLLVIWLFLSLWLAPVLSVLSAVGFLGVIFWLGYGLSSVWRGQKLTLMGLEFISGPLASFLIEEV